MFMSDRDATPKTIATPSGISTALPERTAQQVSQLEELAQIGMDLASTLQKQAAAVRSPAQAAAVERAFDRISREVRLSLAMAAQLRKKALAENRKALAAAQAGRCDQKGAEPKLIEPRVRSRPGYLH